MALTFEGPVLVPVADPDDAERTAEAFASRVGPGGRAIVVHVIEKAGGGIDKASVEQREEYAEEVFEAARGPLDRAGVTVETDVLFGTDVVDTVFDVATASDADAVAFVPRGGNRLTKLLTGDVAHRLVEEASVPVVALPEGGTRS